MPDASPAKPDGINHQKNWSFTRWWESSRSYALGALVIALVAVIVAIAAWIHAGGSRSFGGRNSGEAKTNICTAYAVVNKAVFVRNPDLGVDDPVSQTAVAANVRLALLGGGAYLRGQLADEPATPADLAKAVHSMANTLEQMGLGYLARDDSSAIEPLREELGAEMREINKICA